MLPSEYQELQKQFERQRLEQSEMQRMQSPYYVSQQQRGVQYETRIINTNKEYDNIYINAVMSGVTNVDYSLLPNGPTIGMKTLEAEYLSNKTNPILEKCSDYYCSVLRFTVPLNYLPLMIMPIIPNQPPLTQNPNLTPMIIGIEYNGTNYPIQLIYTPTVKNLSPPEQILPKQVVTPYYYVYEYVTLLAMINKALSEAYIASGIPALFPPGAAPISPYFVSDSGKFSLICHKMFSELFPPLVSIPKIYINTLLRSYLDVFFYDFYGYNQPFGHDFEFITRKVNNSGYLYYPSKSMAYTIPGQTPVYPADYYIFTQEYAALQAWESIQKIVITSSTIPIKNEFVPASNSSNEDLTVSFPILTDFSPSIETDNPSSAKSIAYYYPRAQYRLIDMVTDTPLQKLDLQVYWQDSQGNHYPVDLGPYQQCEIKLGFFKKDLYKQPKE